MRFHVRRPVLAALCLVASLYCYAGYAMMASFSVAHPERDYSSPARLYAAGMVISLVAALGLGLTSWLRARAARLHAGSSHRSGLDG